MMDKMKQLNQLRVRMKKLQKDLEKLNFEGQSKNGLVVCVANGNSTVQEIRIEDEILEKDDKKLLQKSIKQAVNQAMEKASKVAEERMAEFRGQIPGL